MGAIWTNVADQALKQAITSSFEMTLDFWLETTEASRAQAVALFLSRDIGLVEVSRRLRRVVRQPSGLYKEPFLAFAPSLPYLALEGCRIVHIYRDGRDAADSLERTYDPLTNAALQNPANNEVLLTRLWGSTNIPWWVDRGFEKQFIESTPYVRCVWMWRAMVNRTHSFATLPDVVESGRVIEVCYEKLVCDPKDEGQRLLDHIENRGNRRTWARLQQAHNRSIGIHQMRSEQEVTLATSLAAHELEMLGYDLSTGPRRSS
jgi:hypothetical protein